MKPRYSGKNIGVDKFLDIAFTLYLAWLPSGMISDSILRNWSRISSDGFDWIVQGRLILDSEVVFPILRNPGFVGVSYLDGLTGGNGVVFWLVNFLGLFLQYLAIKAFARKYRVNNLILILISLTYFSCFIHFYSFYVLADTFAVGLVAFSIAVIQTNRDLNRAQTQGLVLLLLVASLSQIYSLIGLFVLIAGYVRDKKYFFGLMLFSEFITIFLTIELLYYKFITHLSVPKQVSLLQISLDMKDFYLNLLFLTIMLPVILAMLIVFVFNNKVDTYRNLYKSWDVLPGLLMSIAPLFYQWEESRFIYLGYALLVPVLLLRSVHLISRESFFEGRRQLSSLILIVGIAGTVIISPTDFWKPTLKNVGFENFWVIKMKQSTNSSSGPYEGLMEKVEDYCTDNKVAKINPKEFSALATEDPYTRTILELTAQYCIYK
jgi:hypothetical protein